MWYAYGILVVIKVIVWLLLTTLGQRKIRAPFPEQGEEAGQSQANRKWSLNSHISHKYEEQLYINKVSPHSQFLGLNPLYVLAVPLWSHCGYSSRTCVVLKGDSKLHLAVKVSVDGGLSPCNCFARDWRTSQGAPCLSPYDSWDRHQLPANPS